MSRYALLALCFLCPLALRADDLNDILERDRVAAQRLEAEVTAALTQAKALDKSDLGRAKQVLDDALAKITNSPVLSDDQRDDLRRRVQSRRAELARLLRGQELADEEAARRASDKAKRERSGDPAAPNRSETVKKYVASTHEQIAAAQRLNDQKAKGNLGVLSSLDASATPIDGVVEYPKYWAQLTESRKNFTGNRMTAKETALLKGLNSTLSVDFKDAPFKDVISYLQEKAGIGIIVDENSLKDLMIEYNDPVNFKINKVTVRTILKKVLGDRGLGYVLKEGTVQVVTAQRARETMVVRSYPIDDLMGLNNQLYGPMLNRALMLNNVQSLIQNIQSAVDPGLWNTNGGPGYITYHEASRALIIRAPAEMHYMMGSGGV